MILSQKQKRKKEYGRIEESGLIKVDVDVFSKVVMAHDVKYEIDMRFTGSGIVAARSEARFARR